MKMLLNVSEQKTQTERVGSETLTAVVMESSVLRCNASRCFGATYCLHIQGRNISQTRNQRQAGSKLYWFLAWFIRT
jgi:hypothetical protein